MNTINAVYRDRKLTVDNDYAGTQADNLSTEILFDIPEELNSHTLRVHFDIRVKQSNGETGRPSFVVEEKRFLIPSSVMSNVTNNILPMQISFISAEDNEIEASQFLNLKVIRSYGVNSVTFTPAELKWLDTLWHKAILSVEWADDSQTTIKFTLSDGTESLFTMSKLQELMSYLDDEDPSTLVNKIEEIRMNGTPLPIDGKIVNIPVADGQTAGLSTNDYTAAEKTKLSGIAIGAQVNTITSINNKTGDVQLAASDVGAVPMAQGSANSGKLLSVGSTGNVICVEDKLKLYAAEGANSSTTSTSPIATGITGITLATGAMIRVRFTSAFSRTAATTLTVNGTSTAIQINGAAISSSNPLSIPAGEYRVFEFDGSVWRVIDGLPLWTDIQGNPQIIEDKKQDILIPLAYGTESGTSSNPNKTVSIQGITQLKVGQSIAVTFANGNGSSNWYMKVNEIKNIPVRRKGIAGNSNIPAGATVRFWYDGTYWQMGDIELGGAIVSAPHPDTGATTNIARGVIGLNRIYDAGSVLNSIDGGIVINNTQIDTLGTLGDNTTWRVQIKKNGVGNTQTLTMQFRYNLQTIAMISPANTAVENSIGIMYISRNSSSYPVPSIRIMDLTNPSAGWVLDNTNWRIMRIEEEVRLN